MCWFNNMINGHVKSTIFNAKSLELQNFKIDITNIVPIVMIQGHTIILDDDDFVSEMINKYTHLSEF